MALEVDLVYFCADTSGSYKTALGVKKERRFSIVFWFVKLLIIHL